MASETINLAEYTSLRAEVVERIGYRDNIVYVTLGVVGAVTAFVLSGTDRSPALLFLPWATFILSWIYIHNDFKIDQISNYISDELAPTVQYEGASFGWEEYYRKGGLRRCRKAVQFLANVGAFVLSSIAALIYFNEVRKPGVPPLPGMVDLFDIIYWVDWVLIALTVLLLVVTSDIWYGSGSGNDDAEATNGLNGPHGTNDTPAETTAKKEPAETVTPKPSLAATGGQAPKT